MRLLKTLPAQEVERVETSLKEGRISLTNLSAVQGFVRRKASTENQKLNLEDKKELLEKIENQSTRKCQEILFALSPDCAPKTLEKAKPISENRTELKIIVSNELLNKLKRIQGLRAHVNPNMTFAELVEYLAEVVLEKTDPERISERMKKKNSGKLPGNDLRPLPAQEVNISHKRPPIPAQIKRDVWERDRGRCSFVSQATGRKCESRFGLEFEHILPVSQGGESSKSNLTLHCKSHNLQAAIHLFGAEKMKRFQERK